MKQSAQKKQSKKPKQQKSNPAQKKKQQVWRKKEPVVTLTSPTQQAIYQNIIKITPDWNPNSFREMYAALSAYFLQRNIATTQDPTAALITFFNGMSFQFEGMAAEIAGTPSLETRLRIVHDIVNAWKPKEVTTHTFYKNSYSWNDVITKYDGVYPVWNTWQPVIPDQDNGLYDATASPYTPTPTVTDYSTYLNQVKAIDSSAAHMLKVVGPDEPSTVSKDVSAFAKVYPYVGLNPSGSGSYYNDVESEVDVRAPILAHNVIYNTSIQDTRVPRKLTVNQGGPGVQLAPLLQQYTSWYNKCPISFKFLDMFEVVNTLIYFYMQAAVQAQKKLGNPLSDYAFNFSLQDFVIAVRQSLMSVYKDQWIGQFVGPLSYDPSATNFLPLQILANCYGSDQFSKFVVPGMLAENLAFLQTTLLSQKNRKSKYNKTLFVPVWGYYDDIQPEWVLNNGTTIAKLFASPPQKAISYVNCTIGGSTYINANAAYYLMVMSQWNSAVTSLKEFVYITDLGNLSPPSSAFLMQMTRVYGNVKLNNSSSVIPRLNFPSLKPITNLNALVRQDSKEFDKKRATIPMLPPPTNVQYITEQERFSMFPVIKELHDLTQYFILPSVRLDPTSTNDILNNIMYQTITGEGLRMPFSSQSISPGYLNRSMDQGNMSVEGAGKLWSSNYSNVLTKLAQEGNGGILAGLLGGLAKSIFPGADGVIDSIASVVPF
jgi:hypothetical protein